MVELIKAFFLSIYAKLPDSPFQTALAGEEYKLDFLPYLNFFVPFDTCLDITKAWLACILGYFAFMAVYKVVWNVIIGKIFA